MTPHTTRPRCLSLMVAAVVAMAPSALSAAETAAPPSAPPCTWGMASSLQEIACELSRTLGTSVPAPTIAAAVRALPGAPDPGGIAGALSGSGAPLVRLSRELTAGWLRVVATLEAPGQTIWDRVLARTPAPVVRAEAARPVDSEVQALVGPVALTFGAPVVKVPHAVPDVVAVTCGPLGAALPGEMLRITVVGRQRVVTGHVQGGRFVPRAEVPWSTLSAVASSPLREPITAASLVRGVGVAVGSTDRARGVVLSPALERVALLDAAVPWEGAGCVDRKGLGLGNPQACAITPPGLPRVDATGAPSDAIAGALVVDAGGNLLAVVASREPSATVTLRDSRGRTVVVDGVGAALAVGDLDRDGQAELVASEPVRDAKDDAIVVRTWTVAGKLEQRVRLAAPDGVRAVTTCPPDGPGPSPLVVVTPRDLWLVR